MMPKSEPVLAVSVGLANVQERPSGGSQAARTGRGEPTGEQLGLEPHAPAIVFDPLARDADRRARIQEGIRRYSAACGCELASLFMIGATVSFLAYVTFGFANWSTGTLWRGVVLVLSVSVVGKLLGLAYARIRLHMLRRAQTQELRNLGTIGPTVT